MRVSATKHVLSAALRHTPVEAAGERDETRGDRHGVSHLSVGSLLTRLLGSWGAEEWGSLHIRLIPAENWCPRGASGGILVVGGN